MYSAIFDYKVKFLNKIMCFINCDWLKETLWQYVTIFMDYRSIQYNVSNVKRVLHQNNKLILKFHRDCSFAGWFHMHLFFLLIFLLLFLINLRIAWYQKGLRFIHISYNMIGRIIMAKMDYMENWNYNLFVHAHLSLTLNLIN